MEHGLYGIDTQKNKFLANHSARNLDFFTLMMFLFFFSAIQMKFILAVSLPMARYSRLDQQKPKQLFVFIKYDDIGQFKSDVSRT